MSKIEQSVDLGIFSGGVRSKVANTWNCWSTRSIALSKKMDGHDTEDGPQSTADMTVFVQNLLQQMQSRFQTMSDSIVSKIDEMGSRIDELEKSISDLKTEMGVEGSPSSLLPSKTSPEDTKPSDE